MTGATSFGPQSQRGFTIVELLIVVIVIAILAAITLVAFSNVTNRAKASAAASAAQQAAKKVAIYMTTNADQVPIDLATAGVTDQNGTSYQFRTDATTSPQKYCITATSNGVSSFINNTDQTSPKAGACPGHGVDGGSTVTNLFPDPSLTGAIAYWNSFGTSGAGTRSTPTDGGAQGPSYARLRVTTAPTGGSLGTGTNITQPAVAGQSYSFSGYVRTSWVTSSAASILFVDGVGGNLPSVNGSSTAIPAGTWTRVTVTGVAPAGTAAMRPWVATTSGAALPPANSTFDADGFMLTSGAIIVPYGDGDAPGWAWNGAANNSSSTGPAL